MGPCAGSSLRALLETLEDPGASPGVLTDGLLTLTNRLTGEEGKEFAAEVGKHFPQLYKIFKTHIPTENSELSSAALQALGFCVFNPKIASLLCETEMHELLSILNSVAIKSGDKNTRTRALWVISKQSFPPHIVGKLVPSTIAMLETVLHKGDLHSMVVEYEALNVIIRLIEQAPSLMEEQAVKWAKLIIPLVVHSAHKVQLRGATALEMGVPLLQKHPEVAAVTEELMTIKVIPELQKLFSSKHETYVLKLWPLFVKLLGKALHRSGSFINSLLQLEELGFRSGSPVVKKIAFIAWKSLIDNFALNPEILCSAKRLKLLMQPLSSIHVRTETLALTKLEVWWYLLMRLGPQLPAHFEQVCVPLIQSTLSLDASLLQGNSSRLAPNQSLAIPGSAQKSGVFPFGSAASPRVTLNSSSGGTVAIPSIQLLGVEMLLHFFMGPEILTFAKGNNIVLSLEPLQYPVITSPSFFCKHASVFINAAQDGFIAIGKDASDVILTAIWKEIIGFVKAAIESGNKRERQSSEILTTLLQTLKNIILSKEFPVLKSLSLIEVAIKELPPKVLGSPAYQVADMDLLNGTPALFLIQLSFCEDLLKCGVQNERFFLAYESLVEYVLSGPTSPLAFSESVLTVVNQSALHLENKEHLWRIWSIVVNPLTEWIKQTNEVNQGDTLEHNFSAIYCALLLPVKYIFSSSEFPQPIMKTLLRSWSELYRAFARCALLVATAEDNLCCDELCAKIISGLEDEAHLNQSMLDGLSHITSVMVECISFAPYDKKYQPTNRSPQTPVDWAKRKKDPLGKLSSLIKLLVILINSLQMLASKESGSEQLAPVGSVIVGVLQNIIGHISLPSVIRSVFGSITKPLAELYEKTKSANTSRMTNGLNNKFEKLLAESIVCLQSHYTGSFNSELLEELSPLLSVMLLNKNKQLCSQAAQFWNATFGKAVNLTYPKELKSVLYRAKQKFILLLPAFESCEIMDECNVTYSDYTENSQWDANISGITVKPNGKRDSFLAQTNEPEEKSINSHITPVKMKLEFSVSKPNRKNMLLEEENTVDFVFIPPETKDRVLTEHQKEVLRTKRVDIPVMYNNLDASQDATLFSQDTQNQEDSLEKPTVVDTKEEHGKKENKLTPQNGEATSHQLVIPNEVIGNDTSNVSPEIISSTTAEQPNILRKQCDLKNEELNACVPVQSSTLDTTLNENPSNCSSSSSSSVSSDIISGTPQPVSRRQSFITLEKFDGLENRPFSPSTFSNNSVTNGSVALLVQKESTIVSNVSSEEKSNTENKDALKLRTEEAVTRTKRTCLEILNAVETCVKAKKPKEENKANPKLQSNNMIGITKSSLRQNKTDSSEDKNSKQMQSEQEGKIQVSDQRWEDKHGLTVDMQVAERLLENQSQVPSVVVTGSTAVESKPLLEIIPERNAGPGLEHKENTPPAIDVHEEAVSNVNQSTDISLNQKALRRSLRRKPETDGTVDSQDKENNQQKKDRRKDDEKVLPKKMTQNRETSGQKEKAIPEKTIDAPISVPVSNATDGVNSKECHASRNIQEQLSTNIGKSEGSPASDIEGSGPDTTGEKPKVFPRYHTRRASQGLLTSIENSESDSSETREEGTKRKRSRKLKKNDSPGNQVKEEPENQELCSQTTVEIQATSIGKHEIHSGGEMEVALIASNSKEISTKEEKNTLPLSTCLDLKENTGTTHHRVSSDTERKSANRIESTSEPFLESRQETSILDTNSVVRNNSNGVSEEDASATAISALAPSKKLLDTPECQHKRSKRARKSRSCDCCDEKLSPQVEKLPPELKKASTPEPKLKEHKRMLSKVTVALTSIPTAEDAHLAERLSTEPCATSTPLPLVKDCGDPKEAGRIADSVSDALRDEDTPNVELGKLARVPSESDEPVAGILDSVPFTGAILEPGSADSSSKEPSAQGQRLESDPEAVAVMESSGKQSCQLKNRTEAEIRLNQSEGTQGSERVVQTAVEETTVTSAAVVAELQENEMGDQDAEKNTVDTPSEPQTSVLLQEKSDNLDSPAKCKELDALSLAKVSGSPTGAQGRCIWSPSASPSTSILKRGIKRQQEEDSPSSANKNRRVSFANPIYQEELADDIDRRSPVVRTHPCNGSQSLRNAKFSPNHQAKLITSPTKGSLSPGTRSHKYKSSKKCLITEMVKEPEPTPTESIYPALVGCKASVDTILPQIASNIWARGLGQLIRAKNIRTVGDLSSLSAAEIKTLPIRSPKVSNVRKALKGYHEQQVKSRGLEEIAGLDDAEKQLNGMDEKPFSTNEEAITADVCEPEASSADEPSATDLCAQINLLADQITSESLLSYSGNELFEMQEKLHSMTSCVMKNLKSRWKSPSRESTV